MTDYTITTDFGAKDSLPSGNAAKVIKGSEFTAEFTNIKTAVNSKVDSTGDTFTGAVIFDAAVTLNADVTFDTNTMFVDVSENRVGIGNVVPATALDVTGVITTDGLTSSADIDITGTVTADGLTVDTTTLHVDATNDRVGIGTASPAHKLDVASGDIGLDSGRALYLGSDSNVYINSTSSTRAMRFYTNNTERLRIDSSGNVGIGATNPSVALEVNGTVKADTHFTSSDSNVTLSTSGTDGAVRLRPNGISSENGQVIIDSSGNVGIGTTSPAKKLTVYESTASTASSLFHNNQGIVELRLAPSAYPNDIGSTARWSAIQAINGGLGNPTSLAFLTNTLSADPTERMRIDSSGNVGIGTDSPVAKLEVSGGIVNYPIVVRSSDQYAGIAFADNTTSTDAHVAIYADGNALGFEAGNAERMRIDSSGKVGIGTTNPTEILDIDGDSIRLRQSQTPASATATGTQGQIAWDANYIYVCTATNTWKRVALATW